MELKRLLQIVSYLNTDSFLNGRVIDHSFQILNSQ